MAHRVLLYTIDGSTEIARDYLAQRGLLDTLLLTGIAHEPLTSPRADEIVGYEAILGELMPVLKDEVDIIANAGTRLVASLSIGLNHVDVKGLAKRGVLVSNCPGYCAEDVALHTMALTLDLMRQTTFSNRTVLAGTWNPHLGYEMRRPQGQTMGLVFFGNIARRVAPLARALGMRVLVWAPTKSAGELAAAGCKKAATLAELLGTSDVVSLHCPLLPETRGLIGADELALMKPTAFLVNTSRGPVVDEAALIGALDAGTIRAAALDVLANEREPDTRLTGHPHCLVTPHAAYVSREANSALIRLGLDAVIELLVEGRKPTNLVRA